MTITLPVQSLFNVPGPAPQVWRNMGWEVQPVQPPPRPKRRHVGWPDWNDDGNTNPTPPFRPMGWEIQSPQPPPRPRRLIGWPDFGEDGNESPFVPPVPPPVNFESQPAPLRVRRTIVGWPDWNDDGNYTPLTPFFQFGWPIQPPQPPRRRWERSYAGIRFKSEFPIFLGLGSYGFENQSWQPPHRPLQRIVGWPDFGDDGNYAPFVPTVTTPAFFDVGQSVLRANQRRLVGWPDFNDDGIPSSPWSYMGFEVQPPQPSHPRPEKSGALMAGDQGNESPYIFNVVAFPLGHDSPPVFYKFFRRPVPTNQDFQSPLVQFFPVGWEVQSPQPPHPRPERSGAAMLGDQGNEAPFIPTFATPPFGYDPMFVYYRSVRRPAQPNNEFQSPLVQFVPQGWPVQMPQPPHPRPERAGALMRGDDGNENTFSFITVPVRWGYEPFWQPPRTKYNRAGSVKHKSEFPIFATLGSYGFENQAWQPPRRKWERWAATIHEDDGDENTFIPFFVLATNGWPIQDWQPPHPRREKAGAIMPISFIEAVKINFFNYGWPVQPPQPPHPRREKAGAIVPKEDGIESPFVFVLPPIRWGFEQTNLILRRRRQSQVFISLADIFSITGGNVFPETLAEAANALDSIDSSTIIGEILAEITSITDHIDSTITPLPPRPASVQNIFAGLIPGEPVPSASVLIIPRNVFDYPVPELPSALFIQIPPETGPLKLPIRLRITKPDGTVYTNGGLYSYTATVRGQRYVLYNTAADEIDQVGWWIVEWFSGPYTSSQSAFYIVDPSRSQPTVH